MRPAPRVAALALAVACEGPPEASAPGTVPTEPPAFVQVSAGHAHPILEAPARLVPPASSMADVACLATGTVRKVWVTAGDEVDGGAPLVEIASPEIAAAAAEWRTLSETLQIAEQRIERLETLTAERIASTDDLQARREQIAQLRGRQREVRGYLLGHGVTPSDFDRIHRTGSFTVRSPIAGVITHLDVRLGQSVGADQHPLATIVGSGRPRVEAVLERPPTAGLSYTFVGADGARLPVAAVPTAVVANAETGAWTTWFELAEDSRIMGERVGELNGTATGDDVFEVPTSAVGRSESGPFVARLRAEGRPVAVSVTLLHLDDERAVIRGPLVPDDRVALDPTASVDGDDV